MPTLAQAGAVLTIDLAAIVGNWRRLGLRVGSGVAVSAVVKANAYGLGLEPVVLALASAGCRTFFVAHLQEGLALRALAAEARIFVLHGPPPGCEDVFTTANLIPVLNSVGQLAQWRAHAMARGGAPLDAALHVDTGMNRLGFTVQEAMALTNEPDGMRAVRPVLIMTHMACADEPNHPANAAQNRGFSALCCRFPGVPASMAASSGIFLGSPWWFDLVRPGVALYGVNPTPGFPNPMEQVVRLQGKILQVHDIDSPQTVGYGGSWCAARRGRIATVAVGYADGYLRSLSNRGSGILGGHRVPVVGRVSMDLVTFDVSAVPEPLACPGAMIDLIGPDHTIDALAAEAGTIGYEILTSLGHRYHRRYIGLGETAPEAA